MFSPWFADRYFPLHFYNKDDKVRKCEMMCWQGKPKSIKINELPRKMKTAMAMKQHK